MRRPFLTRLALRLAFLLPALLLPWVFAADDPVPGLPKGTVVLRGHTEPVYAVAFTPDGRNVVTASFDKSLKVWQADTGREVRTFAGPTGHQGLVLAVAVSADGQTFASGAADNTARVWDFPSSSPAREFPHGSPVLAAALSPDGKLLAGGGQDGTLKVWSTADGKTTAELKGHTGPVHSVSWSGNGQMLVSGGADHTTRFWDVPKGQMLAAVGGSPAAVRSVFVNPNTGTAWSVEDTGAVRQWRLPTEPARTLPPHADAVTALALSGDGGQLLTGSADRTVRHISFANGQLVRQFKGPAQPVSAVALSPAGNLTAAATTGGTVFLWNPQTETPLAQLEAHPGGVAGLAFLAGGGQLLTGGKDGVLRLWTLPPQPDRSLPHPAAVLAVVPHADGKRLFTAADKAVRLWNPANPGQPEREFPGHSAPVTALTLGGQVLAAGCADGSLRLWNQASGQPTDTFTGHTGPVTGLALSPSGQDLASSSADGTVKVWPLPRPAPKTPGQPPAPRWQAAHGSPVRCLLLSPRGDQVISGGQDGTVKFWNLSDGKPARSLAAHTGPVVALKATADGVRLVSAGADKSVKSWPLVPAQAGPAGPAAPAAPAAPADKPLAQVALPGPAQALALSINGQRLAVGVGDGKQSAVKVCDLATGRELQTLSGAAGDVTSLAFQPDNRTLLVGGTDRVARVLDVAVLAAHDAHPGGVTALSLLGGTGQAVTGGADGAVKLWEPASGKLLRSFGPLPGPAGMVAASRDGLHVAAASGKTLKVWTAADGKQVQTLEHPDAVTSAAFDNDHSRLVTGCADGLARVWHVATGKVLQSLRLAGPVHAVAFHINNQHVLAAGADKSVAVAPVLALSQLAAPEPVRALAVAPTGHLVTGGDGSGVTLWNPGTGMAERTIPGLGPVETLAVARNNILVAAAGKDGTIRLATLADGKPVAHLKAAAPIRGLAFSPNSLVLLSAAADGSLQAWNVAFNPGQLPPADFGKPVQGYAAAPARDLAFAPDGLSFFSSGEDGKARAWKLASPTATRSFSHPREVDSVALAPTGTVLATGSHDGSVRLWDIPKSSALKEIKAHPPAPPAGGQQPTNPVYSLAWHPTANQVLSGGKEGSLKLWDVPAGTLVREFRAFKDKEFDKGHKAPVFCAAFSPDGKMVASGSAGQERLVKLWNAADGTVVRDLVNPRLKPAPGGAAASHPGWVYGVRFTPDGKFLVSVGAAPRGQGYLALWSVADGKLLHALELPIGTLYSVAVSPDGTKLAVAAGLSGGKLQDLNRSYILPVPTPDKDATGTSGR